MTFTPAAMTWDYADRLQSADLGGGGDVYYTYDGGGNRVRKVIVNGNITEERIYLGDYEVYRKTVNSVLDTERETLHISDDTGRIALTDTLTVDQSTVVSQPSTNIRYQLSNHLGTATLELDGTAAIISYEEYHPFGSTAYRSGRNQAETSLKRYRYVGKERDDETGLYYYGARYYAAWLARFVSVDPLKDDYAYYTSYQYAGNKPINSIDLDGLEAANQIEETETGQQASTYTVKSGDSLSKIAKANNISLDELVGLNKETLTKGLKTIIHPGDVLNISDPFPILDSSFIYDDLLIEADNTYVDLPDHQKIIDLELNKASLKVKDGIVLNKDIKQDRVKRLERGERTEKVEAIVFHRTAGPTQKSAVDWWKDTSNTGRYGTPFIIDTEGNVTQTASLEQITYHTRNAEIIQDGDTINVTNKNSIGIEIVGDYSSVSGWDPLTEKQTEAIQKLTNKLTDHYSLSKKNLFYHYQLDPTHKKKGEGQGAYNLMRK